MQQRSGPLKASKKVSKKGASGGVNAATRRKPPEIPNKFRVIFYATGPDQRPPYNIPIIKIKK